MNIETQTGALDGIELEMVDISDRFEWAIVRYEYPYVDGADLDNQWEKAGSVRIRCYFFDNAGQSTYNDHITLLNNLRGGGEHELLHPKYGVLRGMVESLDVRHDERKRCAEIDFCFVKQGASRIEASQADTIDSIMEGLFPESAAEQDNELRNDLAGFGLDLAEELDSAASLSGQISGISSQSRAVVRQIDSALRQLDAFASEVTQPINSLVATISYGTSIPGRILGTLDRCVERVARLYDGIRKAPSRFLASTKFGLEKIEADLASFLPADRTGTKKLLLKHCRIAASRRLALETADAYGSDQGARRLQQRRGAVKSFDTLGRYTSRPPLDVIPMNVLELEDTLAESRTLLQAAIGEARSMDSLKEMALQLLDSVSTVKQSAERIITVTVDTPTPLHVLCLRYGLPYVDAERIMALNPDLRRPSFVTGAIKIYTSGGAA